jgi:hypothetical protein
MPETIKTKVQFLAAVNGLTGVIQDAICTTVPTSKPSLHFKQWWNKELSTLKKRKNKLSSISYKNCAIQDHHSHEEHRQIWNKYGNKIQKAKKEHWNNFLEEILNGDIWIASRYISSSGGDGGKTRIPTLTTARPGMQDPQKEAVTNEEKSKILASIMFPSKLTSCSIPRNQEYPDQLPT